MKYSFCLLILFYQLLITSLQAQNNQSFDLKWLSGNWKADAGNDSYVFERWRFIENERMEGEAYFINKRDTVSRERLYIFKIDEFYVYIPVVSAQNPVLFTFSEWDTAHFVVENPEHDFPQRIAYYRKSDGSIHARVSSLIDQGGEIMEKTQEFLFKRIDD